MDRPANYEHTDLCESSLYNASTLNLHGLPYDYSSFQPDALPSCCPTCNDALKHPLRPESHHKSMFTWQSHLVRCGGDGRCLQTHEVVKLFLKRLALSNPDPGGIAIPSALLLIEPIHLRSDDSRPRDLYVMAGGSHAKDAALDLMISSSLSQSTLLQTSKSADYVLRKGDNVKCCKDLRNT